MLLKLCQRCDVTASLAPPPLLTCDPSQTPQPPPSDRGKFRAHLHSHWHRHSSCVSDRSVLILKRSAGLFSLALAHPANFGRKVIQRCDEISAKAGSIGVRANFILRRISGLTQWKIPCAFMNPVAIMLLSPYNPPFLDG